MNNIITTNPNSWIQEEVKIWEEIKPSKKSEELMQYFYEDNNFRKIAEKIASWKIRTTEELSNLTSTIAISELRKDYQAYINQVKNGEEWLLNYIYSKWKINWDGTIEIQFTWYYNWLPDDFADNLWKFSTYKEYKVWDLEKVEDDDNKKYKITFYLWKDKNWNQLIKDFTIEEEKN